MVFMSRCDCRLSGSVSRGSVYGYVCDEFVMDIFLVSMMFLSYDKRKQTLYKQYFC